jgi:hypothetical protein
MSSRVASSKPNERNARFQYGLLWLIATAVTLGCSFLLAKWASSYPPIRRAPCDVRTQTAALHAQGWAYRTALLGGASAVAGIAFASGWRWWFVATLAVFAVAFGSAFLSVGGYALNCPG